MASGVRSSTLFCDRARKCSLAQSRVRRTGSFCRTPHSRQAVQSPILRCRVASFGRFGVANHAAHAEQKSNRQNFGPPQYMTISPFIANPVVLGNMLREADTPIVVAVPPLYRSAWSACVATTSARSSSAYPVSVPLQRTCHDNADDRVSKPGSSDAMIGDATRHMHRLRRNPRSHRAVTPCRRRQLRQPGALDGVRLAPRRKHA